MARMLRQPATVLSLLALVVAAGVPAEAARLITGKGVKDESLTGKDVRNGTLQARDFARGQLPAGAKGDPGAAGPRGENGAAGTAGAPGAEGREGAPGRDGAPGTPGQDGAPGTPGQDGASGRSFTWRGAWSVTGVYAADDVVAHDERLWIAVETPGNLEPGAPDVASWDLLLDQPSLNGVPAGGALAGTFPNPQLAADAVESPHIKSSAVGTTEVADNSLTGTDIEESTLALLQGTGRFSADAATLVPYVNGSGGSDLIVANNGLSVTARCIQLSDGKQYGRLDLGAPASNYTLTDVRPDGTESKSAGALSGAAIWFGPAVVDNNALSTWDARITTATGAAWHLVATIVTRSNGNAQQCFASVELTA